jgi:hypothetical protein
MKYSNFLGVKMKRYVRYIILGFGLLISVSVFAYWGGYHGGYHHGGYHYGGGNYINGGVYYNNGFNYYNGYYNPYYNGWNNNLYINVPAGGYYNPVCQIIDDCSTGTCILINTCDPRY